MYTLTYGQLTEEFKVSRLVATLGLSLFVMGLGLGPMALGPLADSTLDSVLNCRQHPPRMIVDEHFQPSMAPERLHSREFRTNRVGSFTVAGPYTCFPSYSL